MDNAKKKEELLAKVKAMRPKIIRLLDQADRCYNSKSLWEYIMPSSFMLQSNKEAKKYYRDVFTADGMRFLLYPPTKKDKEFYVGLHADSYNGLKKDTSLDIKFNKDAEGVEVHLKSARKSFRGISTQPISDSDMTLKMLETFIKNFDRFNQSINYKVAEFMVNQTVSTRY